MYPSPITIFGGSVSVWNAALLLGVIAGYFVLYATFRTTGTRQVPRLLLGRYVVAAYVAVLGAQLFAYLFDLNTSALPPRGVSWLAYYLSPVAGPKTLYGAVVFLPIGALASAGDGVSVRRAVDAYAPTLMAVMGAARVGCFLQGCCYGICTSTFGLTYAPGSVVYFHHLHDGTIAEGARSLAVVPTQALAAVTLFALAGWSYRRLRRGAHGVLVDSVASYSVFRLLIELVRADPDRNVYGWLSTSQWIAVAILGVYGAVLMRRRAA